jgi:exonuclease SbcC
VITKLIIRNFQSHRRTVIKDFSPGVNFFIGASSSGKTAVLRALNWVMFNEPSGESFRSKWGGDTSVTLEINGHTIKRVRSKTDNYYEIDGVKETSFGTGVPQKLKDIIQLNETNLQGQWDKPFLIGDRPGEIARKLNKVVDLSVMDRNIRNASKKTKQTESTLKAAREERQRVLTKLEEYSGSSIQYKKTKRLEASIEELKRLRLRDNRIRTLCQDALNYKDILRDYISLDKYITALGELQVLLEQHRIKEANQYEIEAVIGESKALNGSLSKLKDLFKAIRKMNRLDSLIEAYDGLEERLNSITNNIKEHENQTELLERLNINIADLEKTFYDEFPDHCPLCNAPKGDHINA